MELKVLTGLKGCSEDMHRVGSHQGCLTLCHQRTHQHMSRSAHQPCCEDSPVIKKHLNWWLKKRQIYRSSNPWPPDSYASALPTGICSPTDLHLGAAVFIFSISNQCNQTKAGRRNSLVPFCEMIISIRYCYSIQGTWPRWRSPVCLGGQSEAINLLLPCSQGSHTSLRYNLGPIS